MAGSLESHFGPWNNQGFDVTVLSVLLDDPNGSAPTMSGAENWKNQFGILSGYVGIDPGFQMVPGNSVGTPQITVIDPRTMVVELLQEGWGGQYPPQVQQVAQANQ